MIAGMLRDSRIACRIVTGPWYCRSAFSGQYPHWLWKPAPLTVPGDAFPSKSVRASTTTVAAVAPFFSAVR